MPSSLPSFIVKVDREYGLIGRNIIDQEKSHIETFAITEEFLPTVKGFYASIALCDQSKPMRFFKARNVPLHLKAMVDDELTSLEKQGIITPIKYSTHASPVVWVKKPDGGLRMCVDFKATLNGNIQSDAYPLPTVEEIFGRIGNATKFAKVDLKSAYWQIALDDETKKLSVINTTKGLYTINRLQMGMKNASAIFQRCIEYIIKDLKGVIAYQDDVLVFAESSTQLHKRLGQLKKKLTEHSVTVNEKKCVEETESLKFLGFNFSNAGITPDSTLVAKISEMPASQSNKELSSFLGLINYYGRFINNFAELCVPLFELKKKNACEYVWNDECNKSFQLLKKSLLSMPVLTPFSLQKQSVLTVDASGLALGAVLTQDQHPVMFISRKLSDAEKRYSNIEREGLAVVWACKRLEQFLLGKRFVIETDHRPLTWIFGAEQPVKNNVSPRLLKYSLELMRFDYEIKHIKGEMNTIADTLSRFDSIDNTMVPQVHFVEPSISTELLKRETDSDRFLTDLRERIITGKWQNLSRWEKCFKPFIKQLTVDEQNIIRIGTKVVPPRSLYEDILRVAHQSHSGTKATSVLVHREFFWPYMSHTIRNHVSHCDVCISQRFQRTDTTHTWQAEENPWSRLHIDWAYNRQAGQVLVVADSHSGWLEAITCRDRTTSTVINVLRSIFARFGIPHTLVSDNAPEFVCQEFHQWMASIGCKVVHTPEYHPQSNGLAERMVRVLKDAFKCYNPAKCSINAFIHRLLFVRRNTASRNGKTPAELLLGRTVRCPILSQFQPMQEVQYKQHKDASTVPVRFLFRQGANTSLVAHRDNRTVLAHDSQLAAAPSSQQPCGNTARSVRNRAPPQFYGERRFM